MCPLMHVLELMSCIAFVQDRFECEEVSDAALDIW